MVDYTTLPVPDRIAFLREEILRTQTTVCFHRADIVTKSYRQTEGEPWAIRRAKALKAVFEEMPIFLRPGELIVGQRAGSLGARSVYPEYDLGGLTEETVPEEIWGYWHGRTLSDEVHATFPESLIKAEAELAAASCTGSGTGFGHMIVDYQKVLTKGFSGIAEEARGYLAATPEADVHAQQFLKSVILVADGITAWAGRYAALAMEEASRTADPERRNELEQMAEICTKVPAHPATTFHEALQSFWFTHLALHIEQYGWSISAGRFDQYIYPYLQSDLAEGRISEENAWELLLNLWVKFMENVGNQVGETIFQNMTLGGQDSDGRDQSNPLSLLCMHATVALKVHQPAISVRWHPNIDTKFWHQVIHTVSQGLGLPALFNDSVVIEAMVRHGIPRDEAVGYGVVGCVEACVPGRQQGVTAGGHLNIAKALELALNEGRSILTNEMIGVPTPPPETFDSFDDFWAAYERQVRHLVALDVQAALLAGGVQRRRGHCPLASSLLDDCLATGLDLVDGGTRHNLSGACVFGNSNVYDAMMASRQLICKEQRTTWGELRTAIKEDFVGHERLRLMLSNETTRFGNDCLEVDELANRINAVHADYFWDHADTRGGRFVTGCWPVEGHVQSGRWTAATPDGRRSGTTLADGVGACHGADRNGPTALLNSVARLDYASHWAAGSTCNIKFPPSVVANEAGIDRLCSLVASCFQSGGQQLQINVVDAATLRAAQINPEQHRDLIVRVAGFSAYFTQLGKDVQDEIISRTEHGLAS